MIFAPVSALALGLLLGAQPEGGESVGDLLDQARGAMKAEAFEEALDFYLEAQKRAPDNWRGYQGAGNACFKLGDEDCALKNYESALALKGDTDPELRARIARLRSEPSDEDEALVEAPAPPARRKSRAGAFVLDFGFGMAGGRPRGLEQMYGSQLESWSMAMKMDIGMVFAYCLTENLQLGLGADALAKIYQVEHAGGNWDDWELVAEGWFGRVKLLSPMGTRTSFSVALAVGGFDLEGSTLRFDSSFDSLNLTGKALGMTLDAGLEWRPSARSRFSIFNGVRYRYLRFSPVHGSGTIGSTTYENAKILNFGGGDAAVDFNGLAFNTYFCVYFGGKKSALP